MLNPKDKLCNLLYQMTSQTGPLCSKTLSQYNINTKTAAQIRKMLKFFNENNNDKGHHYNVLLGVLIGTTALLCTVNLLKLLMLSFLITDSELESACPFEREAIVKEEAAAVKENEDI
mmetsp:Transcript_5453/g.6814  ORF Transcript_5453/g.6814 Transcript_5453/m.6814 type:complete len:118 (+) Transcript_5453:97-450(+)